MYVYGCVSGTLSLGASLYLNVGSLSVRAFPAPSFGPALSQFQSLAQPPAQPSAQPPAQPPTEPSAPILTPILTRTLCVMTQSSLAAFLRLD